ncbi:ATP-binding cassette domain-containing protein [Sphingobacterium sp. DK4209]|uniref:ATP-binding cassette domain-containing protein n=1 Tax=Sphingobacterium zhuxiongii TaxID=2662364 RepID=A0A5Q0Q9Q3_9SPHI|nr:MULTISPECIES: ATP-binding cassette domain-containing protein [unclassified Sphingobacterium]MVZ64241.1 ATP-binding cassette domain-containing protein [Sphingobacterium sp. DK4209]QGA25591.1 ATP-binding cassette domain-containing protein [Sphingobacterium sp. dk4302]
MEELKELFADSIEFEYHYNQRLINGGVLILRPGKITGLLGRNGCGKSTLMKIIFGTVRPAHAFIRVNGKRVNKAYLTTEVCYLPQDTFLPTWLTVDRVINMMIDQKESLQAIQSNPLIQPHLKDSIADLSGGELRYLEILLILHRPATFILLDEPFTGLSPLLKDMVQELILSFKAKKGILISDHDYHNVLAISDELFLMQNGACRILNDKRELELFYVPEGTFDHNTE